MVVTGVGAVTPIGIGVDELWSGLQRGRSAVGPVRAFDPEPFKSRIAAEVPEFRATDFLEQRRARRLDRYSQFSLSATHLALDDARIEPGKENPDRVGTMMGTALGGIGTAELEHGRYIEGGTRAVRMPGW